MQNRLGIFLPIFQSKEILLVVFMDKMELVLQDSYNDMVNNSIAIARVVSGVIVGIFMQFYLQRLILQFQDGLAVIIILGLLVQVYFNRYFKGVDVLVMRVCLYVNLQSIICQVFIVLVFLQQLINLEDELNWLVWLFGLKFKSLVIVLSFRTKVIFWN
eukprot:TRINITY_DN2144_c0_g1_i1.p1 TRINITY_DN2144_c0_g1~~TRINITY_DN2144_c0_g1_i1.p1  ORF type:complete len:159 (+),score=7.73 TRINITY_DN2144_c0_g1_i1:925-1401(+)